MSGKSMTGTLLLVDDEADLRFIVASHLRGAGFNVVEAGDGREALEAVKEHDPDLIIMDLGMPEMDGIAATQALKADASTRSIPIIMLTGRSSPMDVIRGLEAGAQDYLSKPFDVSELLARVRTVHRLTTASRRIDSLNAELEAEVSAKTRRLQVLCDFMRELTLAETRGRILDLIIECAEHLSGAQRLSLFVIDEAGDCLVCERAIGMDPSVVDAISIEDAVGITGQVFRSGQTLAATTYGGSNSKGRTYEGNSFISSPLVSRSLEDSAGVIGVLNVTERAEESTFSEDEVESIRSIADAGAIALANVLRQEQLRHSVRVLLQTLGHLAEYRDEETTEHLARVTKMARILAVEVASEGSYGDTINDEFIESIVQAAPMHDIGKVGIPDEILTKPGKLTDEEYAIMKTHTEIGRRVLSRAVDPTHPVPLLQMCVDIAHSHHERYDGTGYPRRLAGQRIPLPARIIAIVDAYDAITSRRRYKSAKSHEQAVEIIKSEVGHHFDPILVKAFLRCHEQFDEIRARYDDSEELQAVGA